jgi:hypothetical protein
LSEPLYHKVSFSHIDGITENTEAIEEAFLLQLLVVLMITSYVRAVAGGVTVTVGPSPAHPFWL